MEYEVVVLEDMEVTGLAARTNNGAPDMGKVINGLWTQLYQHGVYEAIPGKINEKSLGIYTDYAKDQTGDYTILVACETEGAKEIPNGTVKRTIPSATYAKFVVKGDMHQAVADFWGKLWETELPRSFAYDFEEYQNDDMEHAEIHIYIGLKEQE